MNNLGWCYPEEYLIVLKEICDKCAVSQEKVINAKVLDLDLGFDSLDSVYLICSIGDKLNMNMPDDCLKSDFEIFCNLIYDIIRKKENKNIIHLSKRAELHKFHEDFHPTCNLKFKEVHAGMLLLQMWKSENGKEDWREIPIE